MPPQVGPNSFPRSKTHLHGDLGPSPVLTDDVKPALIGYQLETNMAEEWSNNNIKKLYPLRI